MNFLSISSRTTLFTNKYKVSVKANAKGSFLFAFAEAIIYNLKVSLIGYYRSDMEYKIPSFVNAF